jgi:hypothetical protein
MFRAVSITIEVMSIPYKDMNMENLRDFLNPNLVLGLSAKRLGASSLKPLGGLFRTLVIGVGKTGIDILEGLRCELENRFSDWEGSFQFLCIDSDEKDLARTSLKEDEKFLLKCPGASNMFNNPKDRDDAVNEWINPAFDKGEEVEGNGNPGHNRQVAVAKLYYGKGLANWFQIKKLMIGKITTLNEGR